MKKMIFLMLFVAIIASGCKMKTKTLTSEEAKTFVADFINNNLMQAGNTVTIKEVVEEDGLYKVTVTMSNGQEVVSYLTKDGKKFFPSVMDVEKTKTEAAGTDKAAETNETQEAANAPKSDKPKVEVFVMSHCPYGTQIEKGIIPVAEALGNKIDFEIKFCDYAMHGEKELDEQLTQYCIDKEEPQKYLPYLKCFLGTESGSADDSAKCIADTKINAGKIKSCVTATDKQFKVKEKFADKATWVNGRFPAFDIFKKESDQYGVQGSPTLVINGSKISSGRDSATLLKTICGAFNNAPEECQKTMSSDSPSAGFGYKAGNATDASCGN